MAYEKKTWRFAAGSLNLKPPGDEIPDNDAREIINLRSDDVGRLSARDGMFRVNGGDQTSPGDIHTLAKRYDTPGLYLGAGGEFWAFNGALLLESNFDGHPLGWANAGGFLYVMNRATQKRHNPARSPAWRDWGPPFIDAGGMSGAATGSGTLNGSYQLYLTFENEDNEESAPSGPHTVTPDPVTDAAAISVFFVPIPANAQIKRRHIYLGGGTLGAGNIYRAHTIENNTDTEASFLTSEDAVTTQGDLLTIAIAATPAA
ncbi:MAG: hypothetical protein GY778_06685, partial [bacterium]|nr:hypothetical protein [bacterium]